MLHRTGSYDSLRPSLYATWLKGRLFSGPNLLKTLMRTAIAALIYIFLAHSTILAKVMDAQSSGLRVLLLPLNARLVGAGLAILSVALITFSYTLLLRRSSLMATTSLYPRRPIEANVGSLLDVSWPESTAYNGVDQDPQQPVSKAASPGAYAIQMLYIGKMTEDESNGRVARGRMDCAATPQGEEQERSHWLTSGSPLTKNIVQVMIWEWVSLWLIVFLILGTLLFNGFFTNNLNPDSFPRLTVMVIYFVAYIVHFCYVWLVCLRFFRNALGGAAWSLLERSKFVVAETTELQAHPRDLYFQFRSIDKANDKFVPTTFSAMLGNPAKPSKLTARTGSTSTGTRTIVENDDSAELNAALATISSSQKTERDTATAASALALDRSIANVMVMMSVTLSSGFAAWTSTQMTENTPNNTATTQIGSLALLVSLSLGVAAMFTSAIQLEMMENAFRNILKLKETKINGLAVDHYRKRRREEGTKLKPVAFTMDTVPLAEIGTGDFFRSSRSRGWRGLLGTLIFGPAYAMLPREGDQERGSAEVDFDIVARVRTGRIVLTTRSTDRHARNRDGTNVESINVCHIAEERYGKESC